MSFDPNIERKQPREGKGSKFPSPDKVREAMYKGTSGIQFKKKEMVKKMKGRTN